MNTITFIMIATIVVYLLGMLAIGFIFSKNNNDSTDFYLGGRKMGPLVTAMSAEASDMSSWLLMGIPGLAYFSGIAEPSWTAIGLGIGTWLNWLLVSRKLRRYSSNINAITIPEFYSKRFHDKKNVLNAIAALVIIVFFIPYTASGFKACGTLFNSLFGVDYTVAMIISAIVIVSYTIMGGFKAVSTTDLVQSIVMTIALAVVLGFGIHVAGGMGAVISNAKEMPGYLTMFASHVRETNSSTPYSALTIASTLAWGLGYFGMPHILVRFMAIEDEKKLVLSRRIATIWVVIAMFVAVLIGLVGYGMTCAGAVEFLDSPSRAEEIIIKIANLISQHGILAAIVAGLILAGILDFFKVKLDEKKSLLIARITIVAISLIALFLARDPNSSVFRIVSFAWAGFGGAFGAVTLCSLFWKRCNFQGALAGMISGGVMVFVWKYLVAPLGGVFGIYELLPAFITSLIFTIAVSLLTKAPEEAIVKEFEEASVK